MSPMPPMLDLTRTIPVTYRGAVGLTRERIR